MLSSVGIITTAEQSGTHVLSGLPAETSLKVNWISFQNLCTSDVQYQKNYKMPGSSAHSGSTVAHSPHINAIVRL